MNLLPAESEMNAASPDERSPSMHIAAMREVRRARLDETHGPHSTPARRIQIGREGNEGSRMDSARLAIPHSISQSKPQGLATRTG